MGPVDRAVGRAAQGGPAPPGPSAIGDGNLVSDGDYIDAANPDQQVEATAGSAVEDGCLALQGTVSAADVAAYQRAYGEKDPVGAGAWRWLIIVWRLPWYVPIVFPLELCNTGAVGVQESQALAAGELRTVQVS
ncbi:MAG TPA: hypothetical protein VF109_03530 [Mycobacteriales bacterium]